MSRRKDAKAAKHLEIMIGGCGGEEFAAIREFFERRGYRLTETLKGEVFRLWADPPARTTMWHGFVHANVTALAAATGLTVPELLALHHVE